MCCLYTLNYHMSLCTLPGCLLMLINLLLVFLKLDLPSLLCFLHLTYQNLSSFLYIQFRKYFNHLVDAFQLLVVPMPPVWIHFSLLPLLDSFLTSSLPSQEGISDPVSITSESGFGDASRKLPLHLQHIQFSLSSLVTTKP